MQLITSQKALGGVLPLLRCPHCVSEFTQNSDKLMCLQGHHFDIAKQGFVTLFSGGGSSYQADTAAMLAARTRYLASGAYQLIIDRLGQILQEQVGPQIIVDCGVGNGYYLTKLLDNQEDWCGLGVDLALAAVKRAAKNHHRMGVIRADLWQPWPIADSSVDTVLSIFSPRNFFETARILKPGGRFIVVTPTSEHLKELVAPLEMLQVPEGKAEGIALTAQAFSEVARVPIEYQLELSRTQIADVALMGPTAFHRTVEEITCAAEILTKTTGYQAVTVSVVISEFVLRS